MSITLNNPLKGTHTQTHTAQRFEHLRQPLQVYHAHKPTHNALERGAYG